MSNSINPPLNSTWLLPQGVNEILPVEARVLENLRRQVLDELQAHDFQLVFPPMMEFLDSLIQGAGANLTTQTFKVPDYDSHKTLGIRADMTPQLAQIDAHRLHNNAINRLCYIGTVLRTRPMTLGGSRELLQLGAEIFGDASLEADQAIIDAMLQVLKLSGIESTTLSLSHVAIFSTLVDVLELPESLSSLLFDAILRKSAPDIALIDSQNKQDLSIFQGLLSCRGSADVLNVFLDLLKQYPNLADNNIIINALTELQQLASYLQNSTIDVHIDLAELHGYRYHTGLTFQAFVAGEGRAIAKGGRYNGISSDADTTRPATGFSADLKVLAQFVA